MPEAPPKKKPGRRKNRKEIGRERKWSRGLIVNPSPYERERGLSIATNNARGFAG